MAAVLSGPASADGWTGPGWEGWQMDPAEERSLDLVQRVVFSAIVVVVTGSISATLAGYVALNSEEFSRVDGTLLWVMTGIIGLVTVLIVLAINRRNLISPWLLLGLPPPPQKRRRTTT